MNIFFLDECPKLAAQYQCDKHVVKMILESAQLLCTAHHIYPNKEFPEKFYRCTHINHPCSIWTRKSTTNYKWLCNHALALCDEYTYRYNKIHLSRTIVEWCDNNYPKISNAELTEIPQCMPDEYKVPHNPIDAYRNCYNKYKRYMIKCVWTRREPPFWWQQYEVSSLSA